MRWRDHLGAASISSFSAPPAAALLDARKLPPGTLRRAELRARLREGAAADRHREGIPAVRRRRAHRPISYLEPGGSISAGYLLAGAPRRGDLLLRRLAPHDALRRAGQEIADQAPTRDGRKNPAC